MTTPSIFLLHSSVDLPRRLIDLRHYKLKSMRAEPGADLETALERLAAALKQWDTFFDEDAGSNLTPYQRAFRLLQQVLTALRKVIDLFIAPSGLQQRMQTHTRIAAFFNERKVDARNLP